ncbi:MAG: hypothetical protein ACLFV7_08285 [Phycisphaerae bacterium]
MSKLWSYIELAVDVAAAYQEIHKPPKRQKIAAGDLLMVFSGLLVLTALGFGIAAIFWALMVLGPIVASLLTAVAALVLAGICVGVSRYLLRSTLE